MMTTVDLAPSQLLAFPMSSLAALRSALIRDTGEAGAGYLQEAGYAGGESVFLAFRTWLAADGLPDPEHLEEATFQAHAAAFFREAGWGSLAITPLYDVVAMVDSEDWAEADPMIGMQYPSCHFTTGLFADFFGRTAAAPLAVLETECRSAGSHRCRFLVGSADVMGHLYERMAAGATYSEAAAELS
jgi:predicted hydrocarbon binding protein